MTNFDFCHVLSLFILVKVQFPYFSVMNDKELLEIAENVGAEWKKLGLVLEFTWNRIVQYQMDNAKTSEAVYSMLADWKNAYNDPEKEMRTCLQVAMARSCSTQNVGLEDGNLDNDFFLYQLGECLGDKWRDIGILLKVSDSQLQGIERDHKHRMSDAAMSMLHQWRNANASKDHLSLRLVDSITKVGMGDLATKVSVCVRDNSLHGIKAQDLQFVIDDSGKEVLLGSGGFGNIFKALYLPTREHVAVKIIHYGSRLKKNVQEKLLKEAQTMIALPGQYTVGFKGLILDEERDRYGIVMELMESGSLRDLLEEELVDWERKILFICDIYRGMAFLHSRGLAHKDLKASNVLLDSSFIAKISDLAQAQFVLLTSTVSKIPVSACTSSHKAPEMFDKDLVIGLPVDVWSSGITVFETCAELERDSTSDYKRLPFDKNVTDLQLGMLYLIKKESPVTGEVIKIKIGNECPEIFIKHIKVCTNVDPSQRPTFTKLLENMEDYARSTCSNTVRWQNADKKLSATPAKPHETTLLQGKLSLTCFFCCFSF